MTNAIATTAKDKMTTLRKALEANRASFAAMASKFVDPDRLIKTALVAASKNPVILQADTTTVIRSIMQAAELGLDPSGAFGGAHLVPFKNHKANRMECQLIVDYRGLVDLAYRTGAVTFIEARVVYEGDNFSLAYGDTPSLTHIPDLKGDRSEGSIIAFYAVARVKDSDLPLIEVMTKQEVDAIRARSRAGSSGPWSEHYAQMGRKTVIKRICNYLPRRPAELSRAIDADNSAEFETPLAVEVVEENAASLQENPAAAPGPEPKAAQPTVEATKHRIHELFES